jgi:hypothetical protein
MDWPTRFLSFAVRCLPAERAEWGAAMLAELAQLHQRSLIMLCRA